MIKINLIILILVSLVGNAFSKEASEGEIFKKVFGNKQEAKIVNLPLFLKEKYIGELTVAVENDKIKSINGLSLIQTLKNVLNEIEIKKLILLKKENFTTSDLPFEIEYISSNLKLQIKASESMLRPNDSFFQDELLPYYAKEAIRPSPFGAAINWKLNRTFFESSIEKSYTSFLTDSFFNVKGFVLENQMEYSNDRRPYWYRGDTTLIKDDENDLVRYSLGDVTSNSIGYLSSRTMGGFSLSRNFDINPYQSHTPTNNTEFTLDSRSLVRYFINNSLIKTEYLNPGKYSIKNIPLNNGINNIIVESENEFGEKKVFHFRESFSTELLNAGDSKFDLSSGYLSNLINYKKVYETNKGVASSGYYKRGWSQHYTNSFYAQNRLDYNMFGMENIVSSKVGNWSLGAANTKNAGNGGNAGYLGYSVSGYSTLFSTSHNLNLRAELREKKFSDSFEYNPSRFKLNLNSAYTVPVSDAVSLSLGAHYSKPFDQTLFEKIGADLSFTGQAFKAATLTLFSSMVRDEYKNWNQYYYFFVNFSFPESSTYISSYYESQSQTKKISVFHDKGEVINSLKVQASVEDSRYQKDSNLDLQYNTKLVDLGFDQTIKSNAGKISGRTDVRALSSFLFASNGENLKFGISRPTPNSFVFFNQEDSLKDQILKVKAQESSTQTETTLGNKLIVTDLIPYQYRRIQIDPSYLKEGYSLNKESYIVFPTFKSAHLLSVKSLGVVAIKGKLIDKKGNPIALESGSIKLESGEEYMFFTNKIGLFFIDSIKTGKAKLKLNDSKNHEVNLEIKKDTVGILNLKDVVLEEN